MTEESAQKGIEIPERVIDDLKKMKARRIFLQYPEGIKMRMQKIVKNLEKEGFDVVLCLQECFGACDIRDSDAHRLGCDVILHIGHEDFGVKSSLPVVFWEYFIEADPLPILHNPNEFEKIDKFQKIGIITSIQFVHTVPKVKEFLEGMGKEVFTHKALQHEGQILGCHLVAATAIEDKVDCFLCITAGKFYGLGLVLKTDKPALCMDLERNEIYSLEDEKKRIQKVIEWNKIAVKDANNVGLIISWKPGQLKSAQAPFDLKKRLEREGKNVFVLGMDEVTPEKFEGLKLDALVNFGCPRIGIDDLERYRIPVVNAVELD